VYGWSQALTDLLEDALGRDAAEKFFNASWTPTETDHEHVNRILTGLYGLLADIDNLEMRDDWNP